MDYLLAHDVGTTGAKAALFGVDGQVAASCFRGYETHYPRPGWAQQNPEDWWDAVTATTRDILSSSGIAPGEVLAVGFSGQMMGCLPVDGSGAPMYDSLIHSDTRSSAQCAKLEQVISQERIYQLTGNLIDPHYPLVKIPWLRESEPLVFSRARFFYQAKDYLVFRMTGVLGVTDYSDASLTGLMDLSRRSWSTEILEAIGLPEDRLPEPVASSKVVGKVTATAAARTGLLEGTPVVAGGGDGGCATAGSGVSEPGEAYNYIGGTSWIAALSEHPILDPQRRVFNWIDLDPERYVAAGTVQSAGSAYAWAADQLGIPETEQSRTTGESRYRLLDALAGTAAPGCRGLFFLPYLMGERSPIWDPRARGVFLGLTLGHSRAEMVRSVLEGVAYALRSVLEAIEETRGPVQSIRMIGGGAGSVLWRDIMGSVYDRPLLLPLHPGEATSQGAAIAAGVGVGLYGSIAEGARCVQAAPQEEPDPALADRYDSWFRLYQSLYPSLKETFWRLAELSE